MSKSGVIPPQAFDSVRAMRERIEGQRPPRRYFLIVCEGEKTEPNYFESIRALLPSEMVDRVTVEGCGRNTRSLVDFARDKNQKRLSSDKPYYYHIWVVFDKDSFPDDDFDNAIKQLEALDLATSSNEDKRQRWHAAWSNEAFELWYILHFQETTGGALSRSTYQGSLETLIKKHCGVIRPYQKNAKDMFSLLREYTPDAIRRAKTALGQQTGKPPHAQNPATTVHQLVEELLRYI